MFQHNNNLCEKYHSNNGFCSDGAACASEHVEQKKKVANSIINVIANKNQAPMIMAAKPAISGSINSKPIIKTTDTMSMSAMSVIPAIPTIPAIPAIQAIPAIPIMTILTKPSVQTNSAKLNELEIAISISATEAKEAAKLELEEKTNIAKAIAASEAEAEAEDESEEEADDDEEEDEDEQVDQSYEEYIKETVTETVNLKVTEALKLITADNEFYKAELAKVNMELNQFRAYQMQLNAGLPNLLKREFEEMIRRLSLNLK
jgi:hypothetical protein